MKQDTQEVVKVLGDTLSVATVIGTLIQMLPAIAAMFTIVWTGIRIYESDTVQAYLARRKAKANAK
jgi:hypothetical protein